MTLCRLLCTVCVDRDVELMMLLTVLHPMLWVMVVVLLTML